MVLPLCLLHPISHGSSCATALHFLRHNLKESGCVFLLDSEQVSKLCAGGAFLIERAVTSAQARHLHAKKRQAL